MIPGVERCIVARCNGPKWRNWQTRYVQGVVRVTSCEFKSRLRHHHSRQLAVRSRVPAYCQLPTETLGDSLTVERLTLDQVVGVRVPVPQPSPIMKLIPSRRLFVLSVTLTLLLLALLVGCALDPVP